MASKTFKMVLDFKNMSLRHSNPSVVYENLLPSKKELQRSRDDFQRDYFEFTERLEERLDN